MLLKFNFLGHEIGHDTVNIIHSKMNAIHKLLSSTGKVALRNFIGAFNFCAKFFEKVHIILKPFT